MLRSLFLGIALLLTVAFPGIAAAEPSRLALLIGNSQYTNGIAPLKNPPNDVALLKRALEGLHFQVEVVTDAGFAQIGRAVNGYVNRLNAAGPGAIGFFYYSGHGAQNEDNHTNYLIPVDVPGAETDALWPASVDLEEITDKLQRKAPQAVHFVVFDACRNSLRLPSADGKALGDSKGFRAVTAPKGMLIAYATADGRTASDKGGDSGPYAKALADEMVKPGIEAVTMFRNVQFRVNDAIGQDPWVSYGTLAKVYLAGEQPEPKPLDTTNSAATTPSAPAGTVESDWAAVKDSGSESALRAFIETHKDNAVYAALATDALSKLSGTDQRKKSWWAALFGEAKSEDTSGGDQQAVKSQTPVAVPAEAQVAMNTQPPAPATVQPAACDGITAKVAGSERCLRPGDTFRDLEGGPEMVVVPAGTFTMGSLAGEEGRSDDEGPQHEVTIGKPFAVGRLELTRGQFAAFVKATGHKTSDSCYVYDGKDWKDTAGKSWRDPGYQQTDEHPVVCVTWDDAKAYVAWLAKETGQTYRLLSEAEWEYAARGQTQPGSYPRFSFGNDVKDLCDYANGADKSTSFDWKNTACDDGIGAATAPAGRYKANAFGLYDMHGNVWEWVEDCYQDSYTGAPKDGAAWTAGDCSRRVVRGGSWSFFPQNLRAALRNGNSTGSPAQRSGFPAREDAYPLNPYFFTSWVQGVALVASFWRGRDGRQLEANRSRSRSALSVPRLACTDSREVPEVPQILARRPHHVALTRLARMFDRGDLHQGSSPASSPRKPGDREAALLAATQRRPQGSGQEAL